MKKSNVLFLLVFVLFQNTQVFTQNTNVSTFNAHVSYLASEALEGRGLGSNGLKLAKEYIINEFETHGVKPLGDSYIQEFPIRIANVSLLGNNIIGLIEGTDPNLKNEYIVLGAHYDHVGYYYSKDDNKVIFPGADDNASGVAMILELAKYFNQNKPKRSVLIIAFDGEESGLLGSYQFVKKAPESLVNNIKAMFSFDMVGMLSANKVLDLKGIGTLLNIHNHLHAFASKNKIELGNTSANIESRTDTRPFADKGIPSIHVFTGLKSPYHKPEDKADLLDYEGMMKIFNFSTALVSHLANETTISKTSQFENVTAKAEKGNKFNVGLIMNNGSGRHLYKDEFYDAKYVYNFSAGLQFNYKLNSFWSLQLEGLYDYNASKAAEGTFKRHSITVPLNIELGTRMSRNVPRIFLFAGPYYRYNFDGKVGNTSLDFDNQYRTDELGISYGFGFDINRVRIAFTNRRAFNSIEQNGQDIRAEGRFFTLGYRF